MAELARDERGREEEARRFHQAWSLHALRYGAILTGVLSWLWTSEGRGPVVVLALLLSLCLVAELPLHSPSPGRLRPLWAALQCGAACVGLVASPGFHTALVVCAVVTGIAAALPLAWATGATCAGAASVAIGGYAALAAGGPAGGVLVSLLAVAASAWVGRQFALRMEEQEKHERAVLELEKARVRIERLAAAARELAAAEERQRMSEDLHDTLGHALVGTLLKVEVAQKLVAADPERAGTELGAVADSLRTTLEQVRRSLRAGLMSRERLGFDEALRRLAGDFEAAGGPKVELSFLPGPESAAGLSPEVADVLYRVAQEALTNAVRHGKAKNVRVELEATGPRLVLRIADDGVGAGDYAPGMGLSGMVSRVQSVGGALRFETAPGKGFLVEVGVKRR